MKAQKSQKNKEKARSTEDLHDRDSERRSCASDAQTDSASSYSSYGHRNVSREDIEMAQNLIERCLQLYMTRDEVFAILYNRAKLEPGFTSLVWQKLEDENAEFFKAYYARSKLKKQIIVFNRLLERQHHLMKLREPHYVIPPGMHNGLQHISVNSLMGYLPSQLPHFPSNGYARMESLDYGGSSSMVVKGVPVPHSFYPIQMAAMDTGITTGIKQEMAVSCCSTDCNGELPFAPEEFQQMGVDPITFDAPFSQSTCINEDLQLAPSDCNGSTLDNGHSHLATDLTNFEDLGALGHTPGSLFSLSDIDTMLNSPENCDIVDHFIVDAHPN